MDCHQKIDPYGVVFENYDAVGRFQLTVNDKPIDPWSKYPMHGNMEFKGSRTIYRI